MDKNVFTLLRSKGIIAILDGDKDFGSIIFEDEYGNEKNIKNAAHFRRRVKLFLIFLLGIERSSFQIFHINLLK